MVNSKRKEEKVINKIFIGTFILGMIIFGFVSLSNAQQMMTLPNGQEIDVSKLNDQEIMNAVKIAQKSMPVPTNNVMDMVKGVDPNSLDAWRKLITGTIKDVCNDLSITVNEFVKTPVGLGIAALIVYKVAGKDLLANALDIVILIPLWFIITGINLYLGWYFFRCKTLYEYRENANGKMEKVNPIRVTAYSWDETSNRSNLAGTLIVSEIVVTFIVLVMVLQ